MTARQEVFAIAAEIGATIDAGREESGYSIKVEAPEGTHWDEGIHEIVAWQFSGFKTEDLWKDVLLRMQEGTDKCNCDCEWWET